VSFYCLALFHLENSEANFNLEGGYVSLSFCPFEYFYHLGKPTAALTAWATATRKFTVWASL